jgi:hypothetical protein
MNRRKADAQLPFPMGLSFAHINLELFGNSVDRNFVGAPPIPQKYAEWMGHKSL